MASVLPERCPACHLAGELAKAALRCEEFLHGRSNHVGHVVLYAGVFRDDIVTTHGCGAGSCSFLQLFLNFLSLSTDQSFHHIVARDTNQLRHRKRRCIKDLDSNRGLGVLRAAEHGIDLPRVSDFLERDVVRRFLVLAHMSNQGVRHDFLEPAQPVPSELALVAMFAVVIGVEVSRSCRDAPGFHTLPHRGAGPDLKACSLCIAAVSGRYLVDDVIHPPPASRRRTHVQDVREFLRDLQHVFPLHRVDV